MPYPYGASHAQLGQQQPMYHYVPGYPAGYPQSIYRPPYSHAASSLGQGLNSLTSASEQLSAQDEAGPSNYHSGDGGDGRAASDAGGSEYSSILGAAEHEHEHEPEPKPVAAAPARSSGGGGGGGGRKGKRKAIVQPEPIDEEAYDEPLAPLPTKKEMAETKAAKKPRPKRKRPPGSQAGKEKKHKCATCGAAFARAYNLKVGCLSFFPFLFVSEQPWPGTDLPIFFSNGSDSRGNAFEQPAQAVRVRPRLVQPQVLLSLARLDPTPRVGPQRGSCRWQAAPEEDEASEEKEDRRGERTTFRLPPAARRGRRGVV